MSAPCGFIDDGYTRKAKIAANDWHPAVSFEYRPMMVADRAAALQRLQDAGKAGPDAVREAEVETAKDLATRIVSWNLKKRDGSLVEINASNMLRIEPHLQYSMWEIVAGVGKARPDQAEEDEKN